MDEAIWNACRLTDEFDDFAMDTEEGTRSMVFRALLNLNPSGRLPYNLGEAVKDHGRETVRRVLQQANADVIARPPVPATERPTIH